ncbi:26S proteasome non-ATPase regulatory subunit 5 [Sparganum proliferum]
MMLLVDIASLDPTSLGILEEARCLEPLLSVFRKDDPLLQLNCITVLKTLAAFPEGRDFLHSKGIVDDILSSLVSPEANPFANLLMPGFLSFLGEVAAFEPVKYLGSADSPTPFTSCIGACARDVSSTIFLTALETVGFLCRSPEGKLAIAGHLAEAGALSHVLPTLGRLLQNSPSELITRVLNVMADVLRLPRSMPVDRAASLAQMTWLWLSRISGSSAPEVFKNDALKIFERIWTLARQPFYDVRQAALLLLEAIMTEPWGIALLMDQPGFIEYLLNRSTENSLASEGTSLLPVKFAIISQAYNTQEKWCGTCPQWREIDDETFARLGEYVRCGPWGSVRTEAAVALDQG